MGRPAGTSYFTRDAARPTSERGQETRDPYLGRPRGGPEGASLPTGRVAPARRHGALRGQGSLTVQCRATTRCAETYRPCSAASRPNRNRDQQAAEAPPGVSRPPPRTGLFAPSAPTSQGQAGRTTPERRAPEAHAAPKGTRAAMASSAARSSGATSVTAVPEASARPVRPTRCT